MVVELEPGDIVFYNANLWHRGFNPEGKKRWTLHCAFWQQDYRVMSHEYGQRVALMAEGHIERMPEKTAEYVRRYLAKYPEANPPSLLDI
jgi:ectoine hydroxylase-related dioxygenase (phytanoyl-CoA dioxygenase family)